MPKVTYRNYRGDERVVDIALGRSVMLGATLNGIAGIDADCGGTLSCATCHVYVDAEWLKKLPEMDEVENDLLENVASERKENSRLSCQIMVSNELDGLVVDIPERQF